MKWNTGGRDGSETVDGGVFPALVKPNKVCYHRPTAQGGGRRSEPFASDSIGPMIQGK